MKIWDCIEEISSDKSKKFESKINNKEVIMKWENYSIEIVRKNSKGYYSYTLTDDVLTTDWQAVETPVSFMVAVASGKHIKLINKYNGKLDRPNRYMFLGSLLSNLVNSFHTDIVREIMLGENFVVGKE